MKTAIKWNQLEKLSGEARIKALQQAAAFELGLPGLCLDFDKSAVAANEGITLLNKGVKRVLREPSVENIKAYLGQKYATPSDNPILQDIAQQFAQFFHSNMPEIDLGWTVLFDLIDLRGSTHDHFDMDDTNAGISFTLREPGKPVDVRKNITEAKTTISMQEYADGIGILDRWLDFNQFWKIDDVLAEFRSKYFDIQASIHYGLFTALSSAVNTAFATDDTTTYNNAASTILNAVRGKGYAVSQNSGFYIVCSVGHKGRIMRMLTAEQGSQIVAFGTFKQPIAFTVQGVIATPYVAESDTGYYLVLPGRKLKRGLWLDLTTEMQRNIYTSAQDIVGKGRFNAIIGDTAQVSRVLYS